MKKLITLCSALLFSVFLMGGDCGPGDAGTECGANVCTDAEVCCNPLMGICALPDEVCAL